MGRIALPLLHASAGKGEVCGNELTNLNHVATDTKGHGLFDPAPNAHRWRSAIIAKSASSVVSSTWPVASVQGRMLPAFVAKVAVASRKDAFVFILEQGFGAGVEGGHVGINDTLNFW